MLHMFNIKGGFELQAGAGWWWRWGCSRPGQWTVGILWSPTDLPSPGIPTSLSNTQDKSSSIFLSAHPFKCSCWSVKMSWKLNYLLKCSLKTLSMTYCARQTPAETESFAGWANRRELCREEGDATCVFVTVTICLWWLRNLWTRYN